MKKHKALFYDQGSFIGIAVMCVGLLIVAAWSATANKPTPGKVRLSQSAHALRPRPEKYIGKYMDYRNEPVAVFDVKLKGKPIRLNSQVKEGDDWLNGLAFKVKNISSKTIVYLSLELMFPETKSTGPMAVHRLRYGADPKLPHESIAEKPLGPNEEIEFVVAGVEYEKVKRHLERRVPIANINAVNIEVLMVIFDDDTGWATGSFLRRDPNNPRRWVDVR